MNTLTPTTTYDPKLGQCVLFRPTRGYVAMLGLSALAVLAVGVACVYIGLSGGSALPVVVGVILALMSALFAGNVVLQRGRVLLIGVRGFRDGGRLGDTGPVPWDRVSRIEAQSRSLVRVYLVPPSGTAVRPAAATSKGARPVGRPDHADEPWTVVTCQGLGVRAAEIAEIMQGRWSAAAPSRSGASNVRKGPAVVS